MNGYELKLRLERLALAEGNRLRIGRPANRAALARLIGCSYQSIRKMEDGNYQHHISDGFAEKLLAAEKSLGLE